MEIIGSALVGLVIIIGLFIGALKGEGGQGCLEQAGYGFLITVLIIIIVIIALLSLVGAM